MQVRFVKINPQEYKLHILRDDQTEDEVILNYREFLRHDLVHFVLEKNAGLSNSFYGQLAKGKKLEEFSTESMKKRGEKFEGELATTEMIVGPLQGVLSSNQELNLDYLKESIQAQGFTVPDFLDASFLAAVLREVKGLVKRYDALSVGDVLELEFFSDLSKKSFCGNPGGMGKLFGKINELGNIKE